MNDGFLKNVIHALTNQYQRTVVANFLFWIQDGVRDRARKLFEPEQIEIPEEKLKTLADSSAPYRLHLGCGNIEINGFCNVDVLETVGVDIVDDIRSLNKFPNDYAEEIYVCHVLEHSAHDEVLTILKRWYEVLNLGGVIRFPRHTLTGS